MGLHAVSLMQSPPGPYTVIDGRRYLYFAGTGYLGLQDHPEIVRALCEGARKYGINSATSRAGLGTTPPLLEVERLAARFFGSEDSFYYSTGYAGNFILLSALADRMDAVFIDERSHYCLREAALLTRRPIHTFRHLDAEDLRAGLRARLKPSQRPLLMSDGVFAARGSIAPVAEYAAVLSDYPGALILLDDAHGVGVLGDHGRGTFEHARVFDRVNTEDGGAPDGGASDGGPRLMMCATLSKALGGYGGILPGSRGFLEHVQSASHWFDGASAPAAPVAAATARALELVLADPGCRARLRHNAKMLRDGLRQMGLEVEDTPVPIICLVLGTADNMRRIQRELQAQGILVIHRAVYSGLGAEGALRLAVFATHTDAMIQRLLDALRPVL